MDSIRIRGARTHNLKNLSLELPRNRLVVITGLSGSGKSSLAFDTLYAEGQRRYVESLSAYARQFLQLMEKPDVDLIEGLSPAIAIEQKAASHNPRSTVGTVTEIHDYLRLLYARVGTPYCPEHNLALQAQTVAQMVDHVLALPEDTKLMILAPVIARRKGEQAELLDELRAQGFTRVRIDGRVHELDAAPRLSKNVKHSVDVVIDRLRVRADTKQRLAESFETALRHADGRALVVETDSHKEHLFSAKFSCPLCDYALPELEPRLFSFNNPMGACPRCDGLGAIEFFDPKRIVAHPNLSLASGAIRGWDRRNHFYYSMLQSLAGHYGFDVEQPWELLDEKVQQLILSGSGKEKIAFTYLSERGRTTVKEHAFEGVIPNLERRYRETDSIVVREELAKHLNTRVCPECGGSRLRREARHVRILDKTLFEVSGWPLRKTLDFYRNLQLEGARGQVAERIVREIANRLEFLVNVGLDYLALERSAETLSGGEAQRIRLASQIGSGLTGVMYVLDEPSIGLHQRDNARLIETLKHLRDLARSSFRNHFKSPVAHRALSGARADHRGAAAAQQAELQSPGRTRRDRQQPEGHRSRAAARAAGVRDRRIGLGKVHAHQRHGLCGGGAQPLRQRRRAGAARVDRRPGAPRQGDQRRPEPDRPHAALQPCNLYRIVHAHPGIVRERARGTPARV